MASAGKAPDIRDHFRDPEAAVEHYSRKFSRAQVDRLSQIEDIPIQGRAIVDDCWRLYEEGGFDAFHRFSAKLHRIGADTIFEGIRKRDRERAKEVPERDRDDKTSLILFLIEWEWEKEVELISALRTFKNKRTYQRKVVDGERKFEELNENAIGAIKENVSSALPEINQSQKYKIALKDVDHLGEDTLVIRFASESRSSNYRQFKFRESESEEFSGGMNEEIESHSYWPIKTEHIYIDYLRNEYYQDVKRSSEQLLKPVLSALYTDFEYGTRVKFADPLDFSDQTPQDFVDNRIEKYRDELDAASDISDDQREEYENILEQLESAEQTALILENINAEGDPLRIEIGTEQDITEFIEAQGWGPQIEELNEKSQQREYTLKIGDRTVHVSGTKISIMGDISEEEEKVMTSLLRKDGVIL